LAKRIFDIIFSLIVLCCCAPFFILAVFIIKIDSKGPVIFKQKRVGYNGRIFYILKFRTMNTIQGDLLTTHDDKRITAAGKFLRRTNFDELPQFVNIFKGEMSVVGPRPEIPEIVKNYTPEQKKILSFKPGFTSAATVKFLNEEKLLKGDNIVEFYQKNILPQKLACDLEYFEHKSTLIRDSIIVFKTIGGTFHV